MAVVAGQLEDATASIPLADQPVGPVQPMRVATRRPELAGAVAPLLLVAQPECPAEQVKAVQMAMTPKLAVARSPVMETSLEK